MTDEHLKNLLRSALPPTDDGVAARDVWPRLSERLDRTTEWSYVDLGLAAAAAVPFLVFPEWLWLLAYHL
jgi:hypothetical protein